MIVIEIMSENKSFFGDEWMMTFSSNNIAIISSHMKAFDNSDLKYKKSIVRLKKLPVSPPRGDRCRVLILSQLQCHVVVYGMDDDDSAISPLVYDQFMYVGGGVGKQDH